MATLTVLVITFNEGANIEACLESAKWADEIVVVDSGSTDKTCELARRYTNKVAFHAWLGYADQKNYGHTLTSGDWVLSLDADERVTLELQSEIRATLDDRTAESSFDAFRISCRDWMFGRFVDYGSWPLQQPIRLYRKKAAAWSGAVHESVLLQGQVGQLSNPLLHYSHSSIQGFIAKINQYSEIEAEELFKQGKRGSLFGALLGAVRAFLGQYVRLQGFRDGGHGLILAFLMAFYYFVTRAKVWSMWYMREHPSK